MSKNIRYILFLGLIALAVSCKKKTPEDIGLHILPGEDLLNAQFTDAVTLITHTVRDDSLNTTSVSPMLLGICNDPVFGITTSSIYTQLSMPTGKTNPSFGVAPSLDSAVLSLVYNSAQYYGTLYPQKFKVYEVTEQMSATAKYYSNTTLSYSTEIGSAYLVPKVKDSVVLAGGVKFPAHLRITLDTNFCKKFLTDPAYTASYNSNSNFQKTFKGLYIATSSGVPPGDGAILYMNVTNAYSRLTLYYHNNSADSLSYYFGISKDAACFSHFEHNYSSATEIKDQLNTAANIQKDKVFVQPMAGVRTKITIPALKTMFGNQRVAINKAELILTVDPSSYGGNDSIYSPHPKLVATIADSVLGPLFMPDYFEGTAYFGGNYDAIKKEYRFNIARYIQQVLNGTKKNQGLYIITNARPTTANRVQLIGGNKSLVNRMRLKITYTPLE